MFTKLTQFFKILRDTRLTDAERGAFRVDFISYMRAHPYEKRRKENPFLTLACFLFKKPAAITLCLALLIFGASSVAYASGSALPGDALYPIKVNIAEEIKAAFLPKEEKARFEIERTARRIEEATELARKGRLTAKSAKIVQAQIEQNAETISELTGEIKAEGDAKIAADIHTELEATLAVNEQIFTDVVDQENIKTEETQTIVAVIEAAEDEVKTENTKAVIALVQNDEIRKEELQKIAEEISMDVEQETAAVWQATETAPAESPIAQKFAAAQTIKEEGERRLKEGAVKESVALFQEAKTRAKEVSELAKTPHGAALPESKTITPAVPQIPISPKIIAYPMVPKDAIAGSEITFRWEAFDPNGDALQWEIFFGDRKRGGNQPVCESETCARVGVSHIWNAPGTYTVRVRVSDIRGGVDKYDFTIAIQATAPRDPEPAEQTEIKPERIAPRMDRERLR